MFLDIYKIYIMEQNSRKLSNVFVDNKKKILTIYK